MAKSEAVLVEERYTPDGDPYSEGDLESCLSECGWFDFSCNADCLQSYNDLDTQFEYKFVDQVAEKIEGFNSGDMDDVLRIYISPDVDYNVDALSVDPRVEIVAKLKHADIAIKSQDEDEGVCPLDPIVVNNPRGADRLDFMVPDGDVFVLSTLMTSAADIFAA